MLTLLERLVRLETDDLDGDADLVRAPLRELPTRYSLLDYGYDS